MTATHAYAIRGDEDLGDLELLAIALGEAECTATAARLVGSMGSLSALAVAEVEQLIAAGVSHDAAARLHAALAFARRVRTRTGSLDAPVCSGDDAHALFEPRLRDAGVEELHALYLDRRRRPLALRMLTRGSDQFTVVDSRQIYRIGIAVGAAAVILAHNHPSGDPTPSVQDCDVTRRVADAGRTIGITLLDHLVLGRSSYTSMAAQGLVSLGVSNSSDWIR